MDATAQAYTRDEMIGLPVDALPTRGPKCPKCGSILPQFAELSDKDERRVRQLIFQGHNLMATAELKAATDCPLSWAKLWVLHSGRPGIPDGTAPCPYCGRPVNTALAKQCPHCNMDWHDPENPKRLGSPSLSA